ncbi:MULTISPECIES: hypothetical protein [Roseateles]|uniref:Uncharacterized protein n=1 Tax=Pelomonas aquatica TaxID=431058 RepID=A0ABU1ZCI6_9BURK|nr:MULTISPECIES: hypothetical protein [Roseateles]KQY86047.1 hypothetical protein ASD35_20695 [Pelomonas sp. Root1444]MDR7298345.1 hypothetical protein [Pelomonas aquatica]
MAEYSTPTEFTTSAESANHPLLSALSRWWAPAAGSQAPDAELGYESALPWTLDAPGDGLAGN